MKQYMEVHNGIPLSESYTSYIQKYAAIMTGSALADFSGMTADAAVSKVNRNLFTLSLTEEQEKHMTDAGMYILAKQPDDSYWFVCTVDKIRKEEEKLTGEYTGTALYAVSAGDAVSPAISYEISDSGIWLIPAVLKTEETEVKGLIQCALDPETETLTPGGVMVLDEETGTYSIAYGFSFTDFSEISIPLVSRAETRDSNGILCAFEDWNIVSEENWTAPIDGSWQFALLHDTIAPETLYATFQVRDVQANRYSSEMAAAKGGLIGSGDAVISYDDLEMIQISSFKATLLQNNLLLTAEITNLGETESAVLLDQLALNGAGMSSTTELSGMGPNWGLLPGETQSMTLALATDKLPLSGSLTDISFSLHVLNAETREELGTIPVSVSLSLSLNP